MNQKNIFIFYGLILSWLIFALGLSGRYLLADQLAFMLIWIVLINGSMIFIKDSTGNHSTADGGQKNTGPNLIAILTFSILMIVAIAVARPILPLFGSFGILLVFPAFYLLARQCLGFDGAFGVLAIVAILCLVGYATVFNFLQQFNPNLQSFIPPIIDFFSRSLLPKFGLDAIFPNPLLVAIFTGLNVFLFLGVMGSPQTIQHYLEWLTRRWNRQGRFPEQFICERCGAGMERLLSPVLEDYVSSPQQVAMALGSLDCFAWQCPTCRPTLAPPNIHLRGYVSRYSSTGDKLEFLDCPICEEATLVKSDVILREPTWSRSGEKVIHCECACCAHTEERHIALAAKPLPNNVLLLSPHRIRSEFTFDLLSEVLGELDRPIHCQNCSNEMSTTPTEFWEPSLTATEAIAHRIGSLCIRAVYCEDCGQLPTDSHLCFYRCQGDGFQYCSTCDEITMTIEQHIITEPTTDHPGRGCHYQQCHSCGIYQEDYYEIPPLPKRRSSNRDDDGHWGDNDNSSSSWGGGDSSSNDFGGGSSDGGGAGGDW